MAVSGNSWRYRLLLYAPGQRDVRNAHIWERINRTGINLKEF